MPTGHPAKHRGSRKHSLELEHTLQVRSSRSQPSTDSTSYSDAQSSYTSSYLLVVLKTMSQSPVQLWPPAERESYGVQPPPGSKGPTALVYAFRFGGMAHCRAPWRVMVLVRTMACAEGSWVEPPVTFKCCSDAALLFVSCFATWSL